MKIELTPEQIRMIIHVMGNATEDPGTLISIVNSPENCKIAVDAENKLRRCVGWLKRPYDDYEHISHHRANP